MVMGVYKSVRGEPVDSLLDRASRRVDGQRPARRSFLRQAQDERGWGLGSGRRIWSVAMLRTNGVEVSLDSLKPVRGEPVEPSCPWTGASHRVNDLRVARRSFLRLALV